MYVTSCTWTTWSVAANVSTRVPRRMHSVATRMTLLVHKPSRAYCQEGYHRPRPHPPETPPEDLVQHLYIQHQTHNNTKQSRTWFLKQTNKAWHEKQQTIKMMPRYFAWPLPLEHPGGKRGEQKQTKKIERSTQKKYFASSDPHHDIAKQLVDTTFVWSFCHGTFAQLTIPIICFTWQVIVHVSLSNRIAWDHFK